MGIKCVDVAMELRAVRIKCLGACNLVQKLIALSSCMAYRANAWHHHGILSYLNSLAGREEHFIYTPNKGIIKTRSTAYVCTHEQTQY